MPGSASNRESTSFSSFCTTMIQKSLSMIESVSVCVFLLPCWCSHLHFGCHRCWPCQPVMCVHLRLSPWPKHCYMHLPLPGAVFIESSHTLSASPSITFPHIFFSYLFSMSLTFFPSIPVIVCIDLSMPCVSSLLSLPGFMLAPPSGLSAIVFGWLMWQLSWHKKPKKIERSSLTSLSSKKEHKHKSHRYNSVQFVLT